MIDYSLVVWATIFWESRSNWRYKGKLSEG